MGGTIWVWYLKSTKCTKWLTIKVKKGLSCGVLFDCKDLTQGLSWEEASRSPPDIQLPHLIGWVMTADGLQRQQLSAVL